MIDYRITKLKKLYSHIDLKEFSENFSMFKDAYDEIRLMPLPTEERIKIVGEWRDYINSFDKELYKRDKMWEALNDDITKEELDIFVNSVYYGRRY